MRIVRVQANAFDAGEEAAVLSGLCPDAGGLASFLGLVRSTKAAPITALTLEHYPAMTQARIEEIADTALARFDLLGCTVIHRFGTLRPGEAIVLVLAAAHHRRAALDGCAFLIDWLKTDAPFWKKEHFADGTQAWVAAREEDLQAAEAWRPS